MYAITNDNRRGVLDVLIQSGVTSVLEPEDAAFAQIQSMQMNFEPVQRTPETIRICSQLEFGYTGVIARDSRALEDGVEWYDSSFAVANYSCPEPWIRRAIEEKRKGKVVVMMLPARTHTRWFHDLVMGEAAQVRFIQGKVKHVDSNYDIPEMLAIFRQERKKKKGRPRAAKDVAILRMRSSFTDSKPKISV